MFKFALIVGWLFINKKQKLNGYTDKYYHTVIEAYEKRKEGQNYLSIWYHLSVIGTTEKIVIPAKRVIAHASHLQIDGPFTRMVHSDFLTRITIDLMLEKKYV